MAESDINDKTSPLVPPPNNPVTPDEPPIFHGSVSLWMGFKTFLSAALLDIAGTAALVYGVLHQQAPEGKPLLIGGAALLMASSLMLAWVVISIKAHRYKITKKLIEREHGLIFKRVDALDLSRVKDVQLTQSPLERAANIGTIEVFSTDRTDPVMLLEAIPGPRPVYERLRDAVIEISQRRGIVNMG